MTVPGHERPHRSGAYVTRAGSSPSPTPRCHRVTHVAAGSPGSSHDAQAGGRRPTARNVNQFEAYRSAWVHDDLTRHQVLYWIYATGASTSAPSILPQLTPDHGFQTVASWAFGKTTNPVRVSIFKVDLANVALDTTKLYIAPEALSRVVTRLAATPAASQRVAAALLGRIVVVPDNGSSAADMAKLRVLAGG